MTPISPGTDFDDCEANPSSLLCWTLLGKMISCSVWSKQDIAHCKNECKQKGYDDGMCFVTTGKVKLVCICHIPNCK